MQQANDPLISGRDDDLLIDGSTRSDHARGRSRDVRSRDGQVGIPSLEEVELQRSLRPRK